mmetsp:Transcript_5217/g.7140  ORF Transcript_5217/g.7140 Transcript_5217/m.7140 type:complete len:262 (-) Transcript_5217:227-1012(-)
MKAFFLLVILSLLSPRYIVASKEHSTAATAFITPPKTATSPSKHATNQKSILGSSPSPALPSFHRRHNFVKPRRIATKTVVPSYNTRLFFFWQNNNDQDKSADLFKLDNVSGTYDGVSTFLQEWSKSFEGDGAKSNGLTTPVSVTSSSGEIEDEDGDDVVVSRAGVQLIFLPTKTSYKSKEEEKAMEGGSADKKKEDKPKKEGGVEVVVEKVTSGGGDEQLRVRAFRCELDEDTMIKEMSEETIIKNLKKAMDAWKKQQSS